MANRWLSFWYDCHSQGRGGGVARFDAEQQSEYDAAIDELYAKWYAGYHPARDW